MSGNFIRQKTGADRCREHLLAFSMPESEGCS